MKNLIGMNLEGLRGELDKVNKEIVILLSKRMELVKNVAEFKMVNAVQVYDAERENEIFAKVRETALENGLEPDFAEGLFRKIIKYMRQKESETIESHNIRS